MAVIVQIIGYDADTVLLDGAADTARVDVSLREWRIQLDDMIVRPAEEPDSVGTDRLLDTLPQGAAADTVGIDGTLDSGAATARIDAPDGRATQPSGAPVDAARP